MDGWTSQPFFFRPAEGHNLFIRSQDEAAAVLHTAKDRSKSKKSVTGSKLYMAPEVSTGSYNMEVVDS